MKTPYLNGFWSPKSHKSPLDVTKSRRNQGKDEETLEKHGYQTQNPLKNTIGLNKGGRWLGRTVSYWRCQRRWHVTGKCLTLAREERHSEGESVRGWLVVGAPSSDGQSK